MARGDAGQSDDVRQPWSRSERTVPRLLVRPLQDFLHTEAAGGIVVLIGAVIALVWANVAFDLYDKVWHTPITLRFGSWELAHDLRHWINDGAMALFFFVVGLEIKREFVEGELRDPRAAALPAVAALGGMVVPALAYLAVTRGGTGSEGWGIPMATDIAFAIGVLALAARGLPSGIRLFLLTLAIVDDIGAILVIAIFYSGSIEMRSLGIAAAIVIVMVLLRRMHVRSGGIYLILGLATWVAVSESGVHATIAGVILAFITPAHRFQPPDAVSDEARRIAEETGEGDDGEDVGRWLRLSDLSKEAVSPLARLERALHPWTSFVVIPLFALANAGVQIRSDSLRASEPLTVVIAIIMGLVVGKIVGITLGAYIATRLGIARLPSGVGWTQIFGVAAVGGIGFTVSLFIADLAFDDAEILDAAKVGILVASALAGVIGVLLLGRARARLARAGAQGGPDA
jgi:Na+:H+ antiporter, NhaA family